MEEVVVAAIEAAVKAIAVGEAGVIAAVAEPHMPAVEHELHLAADRANHQWEDNAPQRDNTQ